MPRFHRRIHEYILLGLCCGLIGALISAKIINSQVKQIGVIDREVILVQQMKKHELRTGDLTTFDIKESNDQLKQILAKQDVKLVIKDNKCQGIDCIIYHSSYTIKDVTDQVLVKLGK